MKVNRHRIRRITISCVYVKNGDALSLEAFQIDDDDASSDDNVCEVQF
jgi:hypothetical protein